VIEYAPRGHMPPVFPMAILVLQGDQAGKPEKPRIIMKFDSSRESDKNVGELSLRNSFRETIVHC